MDRDRNRRRQGLKLIVSEVFMVLAVIITVAVLALIVSGYWVNSEFKIERNGLLQISSIPTGADVEIDGSSSWLQRTNTSKVLTSGEHDIVLSKDGYDSWSKTVNISEGLLYRVHYPRLFLKNRSIEKAYTTAGTTFVTISPNRNLMLLANNTTAWNLINLNNETVTPKIIDISNYFPVTILDNDPTISNFTSTIVGANWSRDSARALFQINSGQSTEWVLLDTKDLTNSVNITKEFSADFDSVRILDGSANTLLTLKDGNLRKIDLSSKSISAILASNVIDFSFYNNEVVFVTQKTQATGIVYEFNLIKLGDKEATSLLTLNLPAQAVIGRFYDDKYIAILVDKTALLYNKDNFELFAEFNLSFSPEHIEIGHNSDFIILYSGNRIASLDMEAMAISEWQVEGASFGWLDNYIIYTVANDELIIYDFDGLNRRILAQNISGQFPVTISSDKWLYYFSDNVITREWLIPR